MEAAYHKKLTLQLLDEVFRDVKPALRIWVVRGNLSADWKSWIWYRRAAHFDRIPFASHESAWEISILEIRYHVMRCRWYQTRGAVRRACWEAGRVLHILQDFFCHSNFFDLPGSSQYQIAQAMLNLEGYPQVPGVPLKITSWGLLQLFGFKQDGFIHRDYNHDRPGPAELRMVSEHLVKFSKTYLILPLLVSNIV